MFNCLFPCVCIHCVKANLLFGEHNGIDIDLHNSIVSASVSLLGSVVCTLRPSALPGRQHYKFSLGDIGTCFQVSVSFALNYTTENFAVDLVFLKGIW